MIGTFLLVGVIWPALLAVLIKGGLGRTKPEEYDLRRFNAGPEPAAAAKPATAVSKGDMQRLRELEQSMEATLKESATAAPSVAAAEAAPAAPAVKKLAGGPADAPAAPIPVEEKKDYQGEYYPVVKPSTHKDAAP